jgi:hypothetical protein
MLWRHFGAPLQYIYEEIPWDLFYITLSVALDREERDRHFRYILAGGDPKKWTWRSGDRAGAATSRKSRVWDSILRAFRGRGRAGSIDDIADGQDIPKVVAVTVRIPDGRKITKHFTPEMAERVKRGDKHFNAAPEVSDMDLRVFMKSKRAREGQG